MARDKQASKKRGRGTAVVMRTEAKVPANWDEQLREMATQEADRTPAGTGDTIQLKKNGQFMFQGASLGDSIDVVIVDHVFVKKFFDTDYDESNPSPPACFAIAVKEKELDPHESVPARQSKTCAECWANEFASSDKGSGRGKACADRRRLAILDAQGLDGDMIKLEIPVTSRANFNKYITQVTKAAGVPSFAVVTRITMDPDADYQTLMFEFVEKLPAKLAVGVSHRIKEAHDLLMTPYDVSGYQKPGKGGKKRGRGHGDGDEAPTRRGRQSRRAEESDDEPRSRSRKRGGGSPPWGGGSKKRGGAEEGGRRAKGGSRFS